MTITASKSDTTKPAVGTEAAKFADRYKRTRDARSVQTTASLPNVKELLTPPGPSGDRTTVVSQTTAQSPRGAVATNGEAHSEPATEDEACKRTERAVAVFKALGPPWWLSMVQVWQHEKRDWLVIPDASDPLGLYLQPSCRRGEYSFDSVLLLKKVVQGVWGDQPAVFLLLEASSLRKDPVPESFLEAIVYRESSKYTKDPEIVAWGPYAIFGCADPVDVDFGQSSKKNRVVPLPLHTPVQTDKTSTGQTPPRLDQLPRVYGHCDAKGTSVRWRAKKSVPSTLSVGLVVSHNKEPFCIEARVHPFDTTRGMSPRPNVITPIVIRPDLHLELISLCQKPDCMNAMCQRLDRAHFTEQSWRDILSPQMSGFEQSPVRHILSSDLC